jgi:Flp pilus assembly protein TadG
MSPPDTGTHRGERGSITIWMATASLAMTMMVGLAVDLGGQVHAQQRAHDLAGQAARAGGQSIEAAPAVEGQAARLDAIAAKSAAEHYLAASGAEGTVAIASGDILTVEVTDTYHPRFLTILGINQLRVSGSASARLVRSLGGAER